VEGGGLAHLTASCRMSPLLTMETTQTGGPSLATSPLVEPQGVSTMPGTTVGSRASASSPRMRIRRSPTIWKSLVVVALSRSLVRRNVAARELITVQAGWWGEGELVILM